MYMYMYKGQRSDYNHLRKDLMCMYVYAYTQSTCMYTSGAFSAEPVPCVGMLHSGHLLWWLLPPPPPNPWLPLHNCLHGLMATDDPCQHARHVHHSAYDCTCTWLNTHLAVSLYTTTMYMYMYANTSSAVAGSLTTWSLSTCILA